MSAQKVECRASAFKHEDVPVVQEPEAVMDLNVILRGLDHTMCRFASGPSPFSGEVAQHSNPVNPASQPTSLALPAQLSSPASPALPSSPAQPAHLSSPVSSLASPVLQPSQSSSPAQPNQLSSLASPPPQLSQPSYPAQPAQLSSPASPAFQPSQPCFSVHPVQLFSSASPSSRPSSPAQSAQLHSPASPALQPSQPIQPSRPSFPAQPTQLSSPASPAFQPSQPSSPAQPDQLSCSASLAFQPSQLSSLAQPTQLLSSASPALRPSKPSSPAQPPEVDVSVQKAESGASVLKNVEVPVVQGSETVLNFDEVVRALDLTMCHFVETFHSSSSSLLFPCSSCSAALSSSSSFGAPVVVGSDHVDFVRMNFLSSAEAEHQESSEGGSVSPFRACSSSAPCNDEAPSPCSRRISQAGDRSRCQSLCVLGGSTVGSDEGAYDLRGPSQLARCSGDDSKCGHVTTLGEVGIFSFLLWGCRFHPVGVVYGAGASSSASQFGAPAFRASSSFASQPSVCAPASVLLNCGCSFSGASKGSVTVCAPYSDATLPLSLCGSAVSFSSSSAPLDVAVCGLESPGGTLDTRAEGSQGSSSVPGPRFPHLRIKVRPPLSVGFCSSAVGGGLGSSGLGAPEKLPSSFARVLARASHAVPNFFPVREMTCSDPRWAHPPSSLRDSAPKSFEVFFGPQPSFLSFSAFASMIKRAFPFLVDFRGVFARPDTLGASFSGCAFAEFLGECHLWKWPGDAGAPLVACAFDSEVALFDQLVRAIGLYRVNWNRGARRLPLWSIAGLVPGLFPRLPQPSLRPFPNEVRNFFSENWIFRVPWSVKVPVARWEWDRGAPCTRWIVQPLKMAEPFPNPSLELLDCPLSSAEAQQLSRVLPTSGLLPAPPTCFLSDCSFYTAPSLVDPLVVQVVQAPSDVGGGPAMSCGPSAVWWHRWNLIRAEDRKATRWALRRDAWLEKNPAQDLIRWASSHEVWWSSPSVSSAVSDVSSSGSSSALLVCSSMKGVDEPLGASGSIENGGFGSPSGVVSEVCFSCSPAGKAPSSAHESACFQNNEPPFVGVSAVSVVECSGPSCLALLCPGSVPAFPQAECSGPQVPLFEGSDSLVPTQVCSPLEPKPAASPMSSLSCLSSSSVSPLSIDLGALDGSSKSDRNPGNGALVDFAPLRYPPSSSSSPISSSAPVVLEHASLARLFSHRVSGSKHSSPLSCCPVSAGPKGSVSLPSFSENDPLRKLFFGSALAEGRAPISTEIGCVAASVFASSAPTGFSDPVSGPVTPTPSVAPGRDSSSFSAVPPGFVFESQVSPHKPRKRSRTDAGDEPSPRSSSTRSSPCPSFEKSFSESKPFEVFPLKRTMSLPCVHGKSSFFSVSLKPRLGVSPSPCSSAESETESRVFPSGVLETLNSEHLSVLKFPKCVPMSSVLVAFDRVFSEVEVCPIRKSSSGMYFSGTLVLHGLSKGKRDLLTSYQALAAWIRCLRLVGDKISIGLLRSLLCIAVGSS